MPKSGQKRIITTSPLNVAWFRLSTSIGAFGVVCQALELNPGLFLPLAA